MEITQLLHDYWWLAVCPAAGVTLLPVWVQAALGAVSIGTVVWAIRNHKKPVIIEVMECTTTRSTTE